MIIKKRQAEKRPLYSAMNKYGIEHFHIEPLEEVMDINRLSEREIYWIEFLGSFKYGYNATKGGDGQPFLDYDLIIATYEKVKNIKETAKIVGAHPDSVRNILNNANIQIKDAKQIAYETHGKKIGCYKNGKLIKTFGSQGEAAKWIIDNHYSKSIINRGVLTTISRAARGITNSAYGFHWEYL